MAGNLNLQRLRVRNLAACLLLVSALFSRASGSQTQAPEQSPAAVAKNSPEMATHDVTPTFSARSNLVLVRVVARDREGHANGSLQKEDFQLFDKGKPQFISKFSLEKTGSRKAEAAPPQGVSGNTTAEPAPPERYVAYLFDDVHLNFADLSQARTAAERHLSDLPATSRAAIYTTSGLVTEDFTDDVGKLRDALRRIQSRTAIQAGTGMDCPDLTYYQADLIQNKNDPTALRAATEDTMLCANIPTSPALPRGPGAAAADGGLAKIAESMAQLAASKVVAQGDQETRVSLKVLTSVVRRISAMPGQRSIVLVSTGFLLVDQRVDELEIIDRAIRANVTINTLNARGLFTIIPGGDASQRSSNLATLATRSQYQKESALTEGDVLAELADGTGGTWFHDSNDLEGGFKRVAAAPEYYYMLGFSPENLKFDGSYHNLKVSLKKPAGLSLQARRGYFAPKHEVNAAQEVKRELEEALFSRDEWHDIPVALHTQFFKSSDVNAKLSVLARIDVRQLRFRKADGRNLDVLTVVSGLFDRNGNYVGAVEKTVDMHLKDETLAGSKLGSGITVRTGFDVAPGSYFVRIVVRDAEGQKMAALNGAVEIP